MDIITKKLEEVKPYENNPRNNTAAVPAVAKSLQSFGWKQPIVIDKDGTIVVGHTRYLAAKQLLADTQDAKWNVLPCVIADDLTEDEITAYRLADNKTNELAIWDDMKLEGELAKIADSEIDMSMFGFDSDALDEPFSDTSETVEDDYEEQLPEEPKSKLGEIYQLGRHRLMCGDSTDPAVIDRLMDGVKADMVFTDPPYGMNLDTDFSSMQSHLDFAKEKGSTGGKKYEQGNVDEFHPEMIDAVLAIDADEMFLWGADYFAELLPNKNDGSWIVWDKRAAGNDDVAEDYSSDKMYGSCFELCWSKKRHKRDIARVKWAGVFGLAQEFDHKRYHPTQKPIKLAGWFLDRYSKDGQIIVDLFGGSGSTLIACEQLNRKCYMCELDPKYVDVIIDRWEKFTGKKATKLN